MANEIATLCLYRPATGYGIGGGDMREDDMPAQ